MAEIPAVEVRLWNHSVGALAPMAGRDGYYEFEFQPSFTAAGIEPAPVTMPVAGSSRRRFAFPALDRETFQGLPGMIADALPDRFGNALVTEYLTRTGTPANNITTLQRLCYAGQRSMGALEFQPALAAKDKPEAKAALQMAGLVEDARRALRGDANTVHQDIIDVGSSAGGARAKAVIGWNRATNEIVSGQFDLDDGFEHWLLKFDVGNDKQLGTTRGFGRIEYAHYLLARAAGIDMSECHLLEENGRAHFMTRRFDRIGNERRHVTSLCGMAHLDFNTPFVHSYEQYLRTVLSELRLGADAVRQGWLRCAYNVAFVNCDDHTKNLAFTMDRSGAWSLAPAYDMCFSHNPDSGRWTRQHQMLVKGKAWDISRSDLLELADEFAVNKPSALLDHVLEVRETWPQVAKDAGVPVKDIRRIASFHPRLTKTAR